MIDPTKSIETLTANIMAQLSRMEGKEGDKVDMIRERLTLVLKLSQNVNQESDLELIVFQGSVKMLLMQIAMIQSQPKQVMTQPKGLFSAKGKFTPVKGEA